MLLSQPCMAVRATAVYKTLRNTASKLSIQQWSEGSSLYMPLWLSLQPPLSHPFHSSGSVERFELEGTSKGHLVQLPSNEDEQGLAVCVPAFGSSTTDHKQKPIRIALASPPGKSLHVTLPWGYLVTAWSPCLWFLPLAFNPTHCFQVGFIAACWRCAAVPRTLPSHTGVRPGRYHLIAPKRSYWSVPEDSMMTLAALRHGFSSGSRRERGMSTAVFHWDRESLGFSQPATCPAGILSSLICCCSAVFYSLWCIGCTSSHSARRAYSNTAQKSVSGTHWHREEFLGENKDKCHFISLAMSWYSIHNGSREHSAHEMHNNETILTKRERVSYIPNAAFFTLVNCTWVVRAWSFNFAPWEQLCNIPLKVRGVIFSHTGDNGKNLKSCLKSGKK